MISFENVSFTYARGRRCALVDFSKNIDVNTVISGPSGSGKSTILRFINGLIPHFYRGDFQGNVFVKGKNTRHLTTCDLFRIAGFVHQNPDAQVFNENTEKEIIFTLENAGLPPDEIRKRVDEVVNKFGIHHILNKKSHELSGGEKHLLTLASIIALGSPIILLDEPFATLDGYNREKLRSVLKNLKNNLFVITEHRLEDVLDLVEEFIFVKNEKDRIYTKNPEKINLRNFNIREPEVFKIQKKLGVTAINDDLVNLLKKSGYRRNFFCSQKGEPVLKASDVSFSYNNSFAIQVLNFELHAGETVVILGPNGAGKTTLMKLLSGIRKPHKGSLWRSCRAGYVPHNPQDIFFKTRVIDELKVSAKEEKWLNWIIESLSLGHILERSPFLLSEGEKKRVAMAAVLAAKPGIIFLDEPTTGQDGQTVGAIIEIIRNLSKIGISVVVSTHDIEFAKEVSCRWVLMENGRIAGEINPQSLTTAEINLMEKLHINPGIELRALANGPKS